MKRALALVLALSVHPALAQSELLVLEQADFLLSDALQPPPDGAPWQPVALPDDWNRSHPGEVRAGWYRLRFDVSVPQVSHALYLPRNSARSLDIFVNGRLRSRNRAYGDPGARNWSPPLIFGMPPPLLDSGSNVVHIRVKAVPELRQGLTRVTVGTGRLIRALYEKRYATQITTLFMFGAAALLSGLLAGAFWLRQRGDTTLVWFAITAFAWAAAAFPWLHASFTPEAFGHGPLAFAARFGYAAPMLILCLRAAGRRWPRTEAALWTFTAAGLVLAWLIDEERQGALITWWSALYLVALFGLLAVLIRSQRHESKWAFRLLAAALVLALLLNAHDLAWWMGAIDYDSLKLAHFHIPLLLFAIGATIVERHFRAVAAVERANLELETRVAEKAREIEASYASMQQAEREKALVRERERIMADVHDGLGSTLVGLLGAIQSGTATREELERRLLHALEELRLMVDALEPMDGDLGVVLGNVRHRLRAAIEHSGVRFHWQVGELPQLSSLTPKAVLAIQRIVLEALRNALQHARARNVTVSAGARASWLEVGVKDDGVGFDEAAIVPGRGLESLRQRARGLGGSVDIVSARGAGTSVMLRLPAEHE